jgi:PIN domain nuclease of toxin-antitoxin system
MRWQQVRSLVLILIPLTGMLIAQAQIDGLPIATLYHLFKDYPIEVVW